MLYSDREIIISDSIEDDVEELVEFMNNYSISHSHFTQYYDGGCPISEPFIEIYPTIYRYESLIEVTYISTRELLEIVGRKNESKEEQGKSATKLVIIPW